jgi:hypothetical protein
MADFIEKWHIDSLMTGSDTFEIPMLDGSFPIAYTTSTNELLSFVINHAVSHSSAPYFINDHFLGCDLPLSLRLHDLKEHDCVGDLLSLWEALFLGESVLVYGSTPATASLAVFAIRSLIFPVRLPQQLHPFMSITDPRFQGIVENPIGIVGVSNPIALQMGVRFQNVFNVGFAAVRGLGRGRRPWPAFEATAMQTSDLRGLLFQNTTRLIAAVKDAIADRPRAGETTVKIMSDVLEKRIADRAVELTRPAKQFAVQLMQTPFFKDFARGLLRRSQSV